MKDIRPQFTDTEYARLHQDADRLGISLKRLVHDRAVGIDSGGKPLNVAKGISDEISKHRELLNEIIRREIATGTGLYEDDVIRLEMSMCELEGIVAAFVGEMMRQVKRNGDAEI